jgi:hypothetical protein
VLTYAVEPVEHPHLSGVYLPVGERAQGGCDDGKSQHITSRCFLLSRSYFRGSDEGGTMSFSRM